MHQDGSYVIHVFNIGSIGRSTFPNELPNEQFRLVRERMHGRRLGPDRFRGNVPPPDPVFLRWHYQQCGQMYVRARAVGPARNQ